MTLYVINSPTKRGDNLYLTDDLDWTFSISEAKMFDTIEDANLFVKSIFRILVPKIESYEMELSEIISYSLKLLE